MTTIHYPTTSQSQASFPTVPDLSVRCEHAEPSNIHSPGQWHRRKREEMHYQHQQHDLFFFDERLVPRLSEIECERCSICIGAGYYADRAAFFPYFYSRSTQSHSRKAKQWIPVQVFFVCGECASELDLPFFYHVLQRSDWRILSHFAQTDILADLEAVRHSYQIFLTLLAAVFTRRCCYGLIMKLMQCFFTLSRMDPGPLLAPRPVATLSVATQESPAVQFTPPQCASPETDLYTRLQRVREQQEHILASLR